MRRKLTEKMEGRVRLRRWKAMNAGAKISLVFLGFMALLAVLAPIAAPHDPYATFGKNLEPGTHEVWVGAAKEHLTFLFGTDGSGRDILSRMLYGARYSLVIGLAATAFALLCGAVIGSVAAVSRKWISEVIMRIMDIVMSFPGIALAAVFISVFGTTLPVIILAIGFLYIPQITRVVRANVIAEYGEDYVNAVVVSGARAPWILVKHVARNSVAPIMVFATVLVADAIVFEASLSFIQAGIQEPTPTWGNLLANARAGVIYNYWWAALFPGLAIMLTVLCLNVLSEGMTDAIVAAPKGPVDVPETSSDAEREADKMLVDPVAAHRLQAEALSNRLDALKEMETLRKDRHIPVSEEPPLLQVKDLCIRFPRHGDVNVVDHVSFSVRPGETMGLVGESGCGKSITSLAIMGLLDPRAEISGEILYDGKNLLELSPSERNALRGHELAMVYQDALSSLNPSMLIKSQMKQLTKRGGTRSMEDLLELVGLDPHRTLNSYPHELSGGQRQRVLIAMALTRDPKLVIADEPTTALDVTVQKQVIELLNKLRDELGFAMVFVSHDLALVAEAAHSITVMYAGQVVEQASTVELMTDPRHEYTRGLLGSVLSIEAAFGRLHQVPGTVPSPKDFPSGDRFAPRSSHPGVGGDVRPVMRRVEGSWHFYADHPEGYAAIAAAAVSTAIATPSAASPDRAPNASPASAPGLGRARDEGAANGVGRVRDESAAPEDGRPTLKTEEEK